MRLLTLNMNMFNSTVDDSFYSYLDTITPDIAFVQECRYSRIDKNYNPVLAGNYEEAIDGRIHLTAAFIKNNLITKRDVCPSLVYDYKCVFVEYNKFLFAGVHLPLPQKDKKENEYCALLSKLKNSNAKILCGDFNASSNNSNQKFIDMLLDSGDYIDLWKAGVEQHAAYYIDFAGSLKQANSQKHLTMRTFIRNTRIDYILAKNDFLILNKIVIDFRTYSDNPG